MLFTKHIAFATLLSCAFSCTPYLHAEKNTPEKTKENKEKALWMGLGAASVLTLGTIYAIIHKHSSPTPPAPQTESSITPQQTTEPTSASQTANEPTPIADHTEQENPLTLNREAPHEEEAGDLGIAELFHEPDVTAAPAPAVIRRAPHTSGREPQVSRRARTRARRNSRYNLRSHPTRTEPYSPR